MASRSSSRSVSCRRRLIPPIPESEDLGEVGEGKGKRIAKGVSVQEREESSEVLQKKKEAMRAYSLMRNKRAGKAVAPILREN